MGISVGSVTFEDPVILAPMSGVSDLPFRRLVKRLGAGLVVSEMIASRAMLLEKADTLRMAAFDACVKAGEGMKQVEVDMALAEQQGIHATPVLYVNGVRKIGVTRSEEIRRLFHDGRGTDSTRPTK